MESSVNTICLPEDSNRKEQLRLKLLEYKRRLKDPKYQDCKTDTLYKIAILELLLDKRKVEKVTIVRKYKNIDVATFDSAWKVIKDYCETGGEHVRGGTRLK